LETAGAALLFIVTPETVLNRGALGTKQIPRRFFNRANLFPRRGAGPGLVLRMLFEVQALRYTLPLLPILAIGFTWQNTALALAQAPILMILMIGAFELRLLRLGPKARAKLISQAELDRGLDLLKSRSRVILTRLAAGRQITGHSLHLVIEQSQLARIPPLTYVSVQHMNARDRPEIMSLSDAEMRMIRAELFQPPFDERVLYRINMSQGEHLRQSSLEPGQVSAHARLAALMDAKPA
jgi:hypothetical protein